MSTEPNRSMPRYETILNNIRKEATKIRESTDKLKDFQTQLNILDHPAPAAVLQEATTTITVGLAHIRAVFREF